MATMKTLNGYGFNATEFNGKTSDNYLKKTDTASDSKKLGGKAPEYYIQPRNLLDNSDFRNPVNQRGQTDYTSNGYTIDRWELYSGIVGVSSLGYITTSGQMYQKIAIPTDKVYTFAIENDAGIALVTGIPANGIHSATLGNALIKLATIDEYAEVVIEPSEGYNLAGAYWAVLYEGTYTAETLPPYVPKGYAAELVECQRYFERLGSTFSEQIGNTVYVVSGAKSFVCSLQCSRKRIQHPSVSFSDVGNYRLLLKDATNASTYSATSISSFDSITIQEPFISFRANMVNAITQNSWIQLQRSDGATAAYIDVSADL